MESSSSNSAETCAGAAPLRAKDSARLCQVLGVETCWKNSGVHAGKIWEPVVWVAAEHAMLLTLKIQVGSLGGLEIRQRRKNKTDNLGHRDRLGVANLRYHILYLQKMSLTGSAPIAARSHRDRTFARAETTASAVGGTSQGAFSRIVAASDSSSSAPKLQRKFVFGRLNLAC